MFYPSFFISFLWVLALRFSLYRWNAYIRRKNAGLARCYWCMAFSVFNVHARPPGPARPPGGRCCFLITSKIIPNYFLIVNGYLAIFRRFFGLFLKFVKTAQKYAAFLCKLPKNEIVTKCCESITKLLRGASVSGYFCNNFVTIWHPSTISARFYFLNFPPPYLPTPTPFPGKN